MMNMDKSVEGLLHQFVKELNKEYVYNEISLQLELGIFLREKLPDYIVYFEKNIYKILGVNKKDYPQKNSNDFGENEKFVKSEIDIVIEKKESEDPERYAIELKYPVNGEYPEQMFQFLKDIKFMEQVKKQEGFKGTYTLTLVDDPLFYSGSSNIYPYTVFRIEKEKKPIGPNLEVDKPTGTDKGYKFTIEGGYSIKWEEINEKSKNSRYYIVSI